MAPQNSFAGPPGLAQLPTHLLLRCLEPLDVRERVSTTSLVCRRWQKLCCGEELLAKFHVRLWSNGCDPLLPRLRCLAAWLVLRGGAHVRSLSLSIGLGGLENDAHARSEAQMLLGTCCAACPGARVLAIDANLPLLLTSWLAGLCRLRHLRVQTTWELELVWSLQGLTALRTLHLGGTKLEWNPAVQLPAALTSLQLGDAGSYRLPVAQVAALSGLRRLELSALRAPSTEFQALSRLSSLTCLHLLGYAYLPESMGALTWLRELRYESGFSDAANAEEASVALQITLPCMRHLTCLVLSSAAIDQDVLAAVAAMPSLLRLYASAEWAVLPAGPWQARLRWLALGHRALLASVDELATAAALEYVNILSMPDCDGYADQTAIWETLWRFAEAHPPLRRLAFDVQDDEPVPGGILAGALRLQHRRPGLAVACSSCVFQGQRACQLEFLDGPRPASESDSESGSGGSHSTTLMS